MSLFVRKQHGPPFVGSIPPGVFKDTIIYNEEKKTLMTKNPSVEVKKNIFQVNILCDNIINKAQLDTIKPIPKRCMRM